VDAGLLAFRLLMNVPDSKAMTVLLVMVVLMVVVVGETGVYWRMRKRDCGGTVVSASKSLTTTTTRTTFNGLLKSID